MKMVEVPTGLWLKIKNQINKAQERRARIRLFFSQIFVGFSGLAIVFAMQQVAQSFGETGIAQYLQLIISDSSSVLAFGKDFALLLVETLPILEITLVLMAGLAFLGSIKIVVKNILFFERSREVQ